MTLAEAKRKHGVECAVRRRREALCALEFLIWGDSGLSGEERHASHCVFDIPCSRTYDLWPDDFSGVDGRVYEGTGIGALYGHGPLDPWAYELAGWNIR
jgi:hypothetical protein